MNILSNSLNRAEFVNIGNFLTALEGHLGAGAGCELDTNIDIEVTLPVVSGICKMVARLAYAAM